MYGRAGLDGIVYSDQNNKVDSSAYAPVFLSRSDMDRILVDGAGSRSHSVSMDGSCGVSNGESSANHTPREQVDIEKIENGTEQRCTFMVRKFPRYLSSDQFYLLMGETGLLDDAFDMLYVPVFAGGSKKNHNGNRGYAFINFKTAQLGALFVSILRYSPETNLSRHLSSCEIVFAHVQGKIEMLSHFVLSRTSQDGSIANVANAPLPPGLIIL